jgi:hypothetical protein
MAVRSCQVTLKDMDGVTHTVEVTAETLYEAVAIGLASIRGNEWVTAIAQGLNSVQVCAKDVPVVHSVQLKDFTAWLERTAGSLRDLSKRKRIRDILGLASDVKKR